MQNSSNLEVVSVSAGNGVNWVVDGFSFFGKDWLAWVGLAIVMLLLTFIASAIPFINLLVPVITPILVGGLMMACKQQEEGGKISISVAFSGFSHKTGQLAIIGLAYLISNIAIIMVIVVLMFFIVGGAADISQLETMEPEVVVRNLVNVFLAMLIGLALYLPVVMALWFAPAIVVFNDVSAVDAMKDSLKGCLLNVLPFLLYGVVVLLLMILATLPLFLGWFILLPVLTASVYLSYRDIYPDSLEPGASA